MASIKLVLDKRAARKDGTYPLKIGVSHQKYFQVSLDVYLKPENWVDNKVVFHKTQEVQAKKLNEYIQARLNFAKNTLYNLRILGTLKETTDSELRKMIDTSARKTAEVEKTNVENHFKEFIKRKEKNNTKKIYRNTLLHISKFTEITKLKFEDITHSWLIAFEHYLKGKCLSINAISIHLRNLRAVINSAIDEELITLNNYPFRKFKIKSEKTIKRSLTKEQIKLLRDYECEPHQEKYRDIFMLIYYLAGINIVDLLNLQGICSNGRVEFKRAKTGRLYSIKVEPEALEIIERYKGEKYLLNIMDRYKNHKDFLKRMNSTLRKIGEVKRVGKRGKKVIKPIFPDISSYWARHTVATLMAELDIPKETIAATLGHGGNTVTDIYINFDTRKIDAAMRQVIHYIKC